MLPQPKSRSQIAGQTVIVLFLSLGIGLPATYCIARFTSPTLGSTTLAYYGLLLLIPLLGFLIGYGACVRVPSLYASARNVWVLPAIIALLFVLFAEAGDIHDRSISLVAPDFSLVLVTWPVSSCCSYSFGAVIAHVVEGWSRKGREPVFKDGNAGQ
jgi:hypothetical protein